MRITEEKDKIGFIYKNKCHPVSQAFADSIHAQAYKITGPLHAIYKGMTIPNNEYYFVESVMSMMVPVTKRLLGKKCFIVFRANDDLFANATTAYLKSPNPIKRWFLYYLISHMDAISTESEMTKRDIEKQTHAPIEINESFVALKDELIRLKTNINTNNFLFIGAYRPPYDHKNIVFLIDVFNNLPKCNLTIIGKGTKQLKDIAYNNITIHDYVEDIMEHWKNAAYYIHLPKYESGPITLLEAMLAGRIPITNRNAGHRKYVKEKYLILDSSLSIEETAEKIKEITHWTQKKKKRIAETFKKSAANLFSEEEMCTRFRISWKKLTGKTTELTRKTKEE